MAIRPHLPCMIVSRAIRVLAAAMLVAVALIPQALRAETIGIVAVGASNTNGKGVSRSAAWPAQLQAMLKTQGHDVRVTINAVNGSTTSQMLARLGRGLSASTRVVILSIPLTNDRRKKVNTSKNVASMKAALEKRSIAAIVMDRPHVWGGHQLQGDGIHFTVAGHKSVAAKLAPLVIAEIGKAN